jgi:putative transposase
MAKATQEHRTCPNLLQRQFKQGVAGKVLLTDMVILQNLYVLVFMASL